MRRFVFRFLFYSTLFTLMIWVCGRGDFVRGFNFGAYLAGSWNTRPVMRVQVEGLVVDVCVEKSVRLKGEHLLPLLIQRAYNDFPHYVNRRYPVLDWDPAWGSEKSKVTVSILSEPTYVEFDRWQREDTQGHYSAKFCSIGLRSRGYEFYVGESEDVIRHEVFHHLWNVYNLSRSVDEWNAYNFHSALVVERVERK